MRFSLTMEDSLVEQIDKEARQTGTPRAEWIRQACTDALHPPAPGPTPEEHREFRGAGDASPDRSLSHRTVWGSYTQRRTYTSGSASRPPGRAAPIPPNTNTSCITRILFFRGRYEIPVRSRKVFSARQHPEQVFWQGPGPVDDTGSGRDFAGQIPIAGNIRLPQPAPGRHRTGSPNHARIGAR